MMGSLTELNKITTRFRYQPISAAYYQESGLNQILDHYCRTLDDHKVLIPSRAIQAMERLFQLSAERFLLLSSDKGCCNNVGEFSQRDPDIAFHGSFSLMVNYHAMATYVKAKGGIALLQQNQQSLVSAAFIPGANGNELGGTLAAVQQYIVEQAPGDCYSGCQTATQAATYSDITTLLTWFKLSHYDPCLLSAFAPVLMNNVATLAPSVQHDLIQVLHRLKDNIYPMPCHDELLIHLIHLYQALKQWQAAISLLQQLLENHPLDANVWYQLALCYFELGQLEKAQSLFTQTRTLASDCMMTLGYLCKIEALMKANGSTQVTSTEVAEAVNL